MTPATHRAWWVLTATLPTRPSGLRVRVWRALKATHCAALREGVYLLPAAAPTAAALQALDAAIREAGAPSHLLALQARDAAQEAAFEALFDRSAQYEAFGLALKEARAGLRNAPEAQARKALRTLDQQLQAIRAADFFPGPGALQAQDGLAALRRETERRFSPGEPTPREASLARLDAAAYQGRSWATRARPWVDRLATAWLVSRFVDRSPRFVWLADGQRCPRQALGFDFDGARFSHVGERVTVEVVAESFGLLDADPALRRLGELVRCIDIGGVPVDEAPGVECVVRGLQARHADDDALLAAALPVFDAVHAAFRSPG